MAPRRRLPDPGSPSGRQGREENFHTSYGWELGQWFMAVQHGCGVVPRVSTRAISVSSYQYDAFTRASLACWTTSSVCWIAFEVNASDAPSREHDESRSKLLAHLLETGPYGTTQAGLVAGDAPKEMRCARADVDAFADGNERAGIDESRDPPSDHWAEVTSVTTEVLD